MATFSAITSVIFAPSLEPSFSNNVIAERTSNLKMAIGGWRKNSFPSLKTNRFCVSCSAKPETVQKVCEIVRRQLALPAETELTSESKFSALGGNSDELRRRIWDWCRRGKLPEHHNGPRGS
ncbi:Acyl carrier protein 4 [Citrus sinensis]|uniref:acyl carrier protein 1, chloroplastic isoform X2 n=1 Tax=Citrus sinensis TaxID=2711 RepID=UPI000D62B28D|nr:acyl carrier protein 1, chloroplastic isoform X2 [Citrus sinensis]KAH9709848.1 Acyl carrier protein 4 [Citrus sinensis]